MNKYSTLHTPRATSRLAALIIACTLPLVSCGDDSPTAPQEQAVNPKAGTSIVLRTISRNDAGDIMQDKELEYLFTGDDLVLAGQTGVRRVVSESRSYYYHYANNGDLRLLVLSAPDGQPMDSTWVSFPYGTRTQTTHVREYPWMGADYKRFIQISYLRDQRLTVNDKTFDTKVVFVEQRIGMWSDGQPTIVNESRDTIWFAPSLGWHVRQVGTQLQLIGGDSLRFMNDANLVRYTLK